MMKGQAQFGYSALTFLLFSHVQCFRWFVRSLDFNRLRDYMRYEKGREWMESYSLPSLPFYPFVPAFILYRCSGGALLPSYERMMLSHSL